MGDHQFSIRTSAFSLGNTQLYLDPAIKAEIRKLTTGEISPRLRHLFLYPDWSALKETDLERMLRQSSAAEESSPRQRKTADPRPGKIRDVFRAIWAIPEVQAETDNLLNRTACTVERICSSGVGSVPAQPINARIVIAGAAIASFVTFRPTRAPTLEFLDRVDLAVPGVPGFSVHTRKTGGGGAGAKVENIANMGLSVSGGRTSSNETTSTRWDLHLMFDATRIFPMLK
jgi:hypothetical protein